MKKTFSILLVLALVVTLVFAIAPLNANAATELLTNGDVESGFPAGSLTGNAEETSEETHGGSKAIKAFRTTDLVMIYVTVDLGAPLTEAKDYTLKFWVYLDESSTENTVQYQSIACDGTWSSLREADWQVLGEPVSGQWVEVTRTIAAPVGTQILQAQIYTDRTTTSFYLDDVSLTEATNGTNITVAFRNVQADNTWNLIADVSQATNSYYKMNAKVDGTEQMVLLEKNADGFVIWPSFFTVAPTASLEIEAGTVLTAVDPNNSWSAVAGAATLTVTNGLKVVCTDGSWAVEVPTTSITLTFSVVHDDGTWVWTAGSLPETTYKYYKVRAEIDGAAHDIVAELSGTNLIVYPSFFGVYGASAPVSSLEIAADTVMIPVTPDLQWREVDGAETLTVSNRQKVTKAGTTWTDVSNVVEVTYTQLKAEELELYRTDDQSASQYRSVFAVKAPAGLIDNDDSWRNFILESGSVLIDGVSVEVIFGMLPGGDGTGWECNSAFLLYVTGEGYRDAATTAQRITITDGTKLISPDDASRGYVFVGDFNIYNVDGTWTTTAPVEHTHALTKVDAVEATEEHDGNIEYYVCDCGKLFADAEGTVEITLADTVVEYIPQTGEAGIFAAVVALLCSAVGLIAVQKKMF